MIKKIVVLIITAYIITLTAFAIVSPTDKFYVNDFADVIDTSVEEHTVNMSALIEKKTGAQIVVVTVDSLEGIVIAEEIIKEMDMTSAWIFVAVILIVILLVLGIISKHLKKHKKFKAKSRKRHHRWA